MKVRQFENALEPILVLVKEEGSLSKLRSGDVGLIVQPQVWRSKAYAGSDFSRGRFCKLLLDSIRLYLKWTNTLITLAADPHRLQPCFRGVWRAKRVTKNF